MVDPKFKDLLCTMIEFFENPIEMKINAAHKHPSFVENARIPFFPSAKKTYLLINVKTYTPINHH